METKIKNCPYCGVPMEEGDFDIYDGQEYICRNKNCVRFELNNLSAKYQKLISEKSQIHNLKWRIVLQNTPIGKKLEEFKKAYIEALDTGHIGEDMKEVLSLELQNLSKM